MTGALQFSQPVHATLWTTTPGATEAFLSFHRAVTSFCCAATGTAALVPLCKAATIGTAPAFPLRGHATTGTESAFPSRRAAIKGTEPPFHSSRSAFLSFLLQSWRYRADTDERCPRGADIASVRSVQT